MHIKFNHLHSSSVASVDMQKRAIVIKSTHNHSNLAAGQFSDFINQNYYIYNNKIDNLFEFDLIVLTATLEQRKISWRMTTGMCFVELLEKINYINRIMIQCFKSDAVFPKNQK